MKMNVRSIVAVFMIGLITQGHAQLYCYVCENCPEGSDLPDELFVSCSGEVTTAPTPSSTSTETTITPSTETTEVTDSTSESSTVSTSTELTTEPTQPSTSPPTSPPTTPPTTLSSEPTTQNTDPPSTEPTPDTPEFPLTTTSVMPSTQSTYTTDEMTTGTVPTVPPTITSQTPGTPFVFRRNVFRHTVPVFDHANLKQTAYNCFVIKKEVNGTEQINRGCVVASPNYNDMCLNANENVLPLECRICATDRCNGASGIILSVVLLLCSICAGLSL